MNEMLIGAAALIVLLPVFGTGIELVSPWPRGFIGSS